jgi:hypothetical protein
MIGFKKLVAASRRSGLFTLSEKGRVEFLSMRTGRAVLWWEAGRYWTPSGQRGPAASAFAALRKAVDLERSYSECPVPSN